MDLKALWLCSYGLYVVSSKKGDKLNGQIVNTVFQVTAEPPTIVVSINKSNLTHEYISASKVFSASILATDTPMTFIGKLGFKSGREIDKFKDTGYRTGVTGAPIVFDHALGFIEAEVISTLDVGTHTIFVGKVADCGVLKSGGPMTYAYYHQVKKGKTPKAAATYQKGQQTGAGPVPAATAVGPAAPESESESAKRAKASTEDRKMRKYRCTVCGYIYDPAVGDPDGGIKPGTAFEDIPDDWACPVCGVSKDQFEPADQ